MDTKEPHLFKPGVQATIDLRQALTDLRLSLTTIAELREKLERADRLLKQGAAIILECHGEWGHGDQAAVSKCRVCSLRREMAATSGTPTRAG
ncbi:MAG: hypothetical protein AAB538_02700 [Patescibacteria group bacterium]